MYNKKKTFKKSFKDLVQTAVVTGLAVGGVTLTNTPELSILGVKEVLIVVITAIGSSISTGLFNWLKNRLNDA